MLYKQWTNLCLVPSQLIVKSIGLANELDTSRLTHKSLYNVQYNTIYFDADMNILGPYRHLAR